MKKTMAMLMVIMLVIGMVPVSAFAAENAPTFVLTTDFDSSMGIDDTFHVTLSVTENPTGLTAMEFYLNWNAQAVAFQKFTTYTFAGVSGIAGDDGSFNWLEVNGTNATGEVFTAEFKIVGGGALGISLDADETVVADGAYEEVQAAATFDVSALQGLSVEGAPGASTLPESLLALGVTSITANVEGSVTALDKGTFNAIVWEQTDTATRYHVIVPDNTTEVYVTFNKPLTDFQRDKDPTTGEDTTIAAHVGSITGNNAGGSASLQHKTPDENTTVITIPMVMIDSWGMGGPYPVLQPINYNPEEMDYYAVGPLTAASASQAYCFFSFVQESDVEEVVTYQITVDEDIQGGTVAALNKDFEPITEAAEGDLVYLEVKPADGYKMVRYGYYFEDEFRDAENGCFYMPAGDIIITATFAEEHTCVYDQEEVHKDYLVSEANCQSGAVYYKSCAEEGNHGTETFVHGDPVPCQYVDSKCKWCGTAEPVVTPGYQFATSADVSANNGETVTVHVKITGHSDSSITTYNAYDLTLKFDSTKLEFDSGVGADQGDQIKIEKKGDDTIQIVGVGDAKGFNVEVATLTFKVKAAGPAKVTIQKIQVSDKQETVTENVPVATPKHDETNPPAGDTTPDEVVIKVPYAVVKPDFVTGASNVYHGESYSFSYSDTTNYTYSDPTVTVGGTPVTPTEANGVYTIENVTGEVSITAEQTANSYDVTVENGGATVTAPEKATYGQKYEFTVTPSENMAIESVTVKAGEQVIPCTKEDGKYVIAGNAISGAFTITVAQIDKMTTVAFEGVGVEATEIEGGLTQSAEIGKDFTFKLNKVDGFGYTVQIGETVLNESAEVSGSYTIPAALVVKGGITVTIQKVDITTADIAVSEYITLNGRTMFLVTAKWGNRVLAYGEEGTMYYSTQYTVKEGAEAGAYCWLVLSTDTLNTADAVKEAAQAAIEATTAEATAIAYDCDVNGTNIVDVNDAQLAYDMYKASYMEFSGNLPMLKFLEADMTADGKVDTLDVAAIINHIIANANAN